MVLARWVKQKRGSGLKEYPRIKVSILLPDQLSGQGKRASRHNESTPARTKSTSESEKETYSIFRDVACSGRWSDRER